MIVIKQEVLVSIIIPVYNQSRYLKNSFNSLIYQDYDNLEIICVDDGSTDNSLAVLMELKNADSRIRIIQQENKGAGAARNNGLKYANGKYVIFLDADDSFDSMLIEKLVAKAELLQSDICICKAFAIQENGNKVEMNYSNKIFQRYYNKIFSANDIAQEVLTSFSVEPWNKLYRRDFLLKLRVQFQEIKKSNDLFFTTVTLLNADKIAVLDEALIFYCTDNRNKNINEYDDKLLDFSRALEKTNDYLEQHSNLLLFKKSFYRMATGIIFYNLSLKMNVKVREKVVSYLVNKSFAKLKIYEDNEVSLLGYIYGLQYWLLRKHAPIKSQVLAYKFFKVYEYTKKNSISATLKKILQYYY